MSRVVRRATGADGSVSHGGHDVSLDGLHEAFMDALCAKLVGCHAYPTSELCKTAISVDMLDYMVRATGAGRATYHGDRVDAAAASYGASLCAVTERGPNDALSQLFTGTVAAGA